MAQALPQIEVTAEWEALTREVATEAYHNWKAVVTPEAKAAALAEHAKFTSGD